MGQLQAAGESVRWRRFRRWDDTLYKGQCRTAGFVETHFTFGFALFFAVLSGIALSFIGSNCEGKISYTSPIYYCMLLFIIGICAWIFITIQLTILKIVRLLTIGISAHYLSYQGYGFYSLQFIDSTIACHPFGWANEFYGNMMIHIPILIIMLMAAFLTKEFVFGK